MRSFAAHSFRAPDGRLARMPLPGNDPGPDPAGRDACGGGIDLLALLAHQVITPLAQIDTAAQRMTRRAGEMDPDEIRTRADRIRQATRRLAGLAHALLERARLGPGQGIQRQTCAVADLIAGACEPVRQAQPRRLFWIDVRAEHVAGDPLLLEQLVAILLCNAAKYSDPETVIGITASEAGGFLVLAITDQGMGIPQDEQARLFEPCFRGRNAARIAGTGMGLHLAGRIAALHGGAIGVRSREGEGSTFTVELPLV